MLRHRHGLLLAIAIQLAALVCLLSAAEQLQQPQPADKVSYDGAQLFRVRVNKNTRKLLDRLEESGAAEKWKGNVTEQDVMVRNDKIDEVTTFFKSNNINFLIVIDDIERAIRSENPDPQIGEEQDRNKPYRLTWQRYHRFNDHLEFHDYLTREFPNIVQVVDIGNSIEGRPMRILKISSGQPNAKAVWIDGGTHAREWISPATVSYIISEFVENRAAHSPYVTAVDFYIAPFINPDGYEYSHLVDRLWRKNRNTKNSGTCSGTDLNRNWGYKWGGAGSSRQPCKEIYAGNRAFSEPETAAISRFVLSNKDKIKVQWKKERDHLEAVVRSMSSRKMGNNQGLEEQLKDARETIVRYRMELDRYKAENEGLEEECQQLRETIALLESETTDQRRKIDILTSQQSSQTALAHTTADIALTQQLAKAQELLSNKEYQLEELNNELKGMRLASGSTKKENGLIEEINSLKMTVSQLQAALSLERTQNKTLAKDRTVLTRENSDLKRQVKEVEGIIKQRNKSDSNVASIVGGENRLKELEELLSSRQAALVVMQQQLQEMEEKYEKHLIELERDLSAVREENRRLKERKNELASKESSGNGQSAATSKKSCSSSSRCAPTSSNCSAAAAREDAHLLATIRGLKLELSSKEKEVMKLSRDLEDAKKTNKRLQREREKQLKTASPIKPTSEMSLKSDKSMNANVGLTDSSLGRGYNPNLYQEEIEAAALIKMENKSLRDEIRRLGKDILTLNNKRLQDLLSLQTEHEQEIQRLINDYTNRHSQTAVAELQGQIYTQQMVINHLKEQLKQLTLLQEENAMLKLERDHLEKALMGANKKVQELATPEACQYRNLLDKFENLERRHEVREQKLQSIVRDLLASNSDPVPCGTVCRNKLLDKNREICYYRVEMDKILEALREFKRSK